MQKWGAGVRPTVRTRSEVIDHALLFGAREQHNRPTVGQLRAEEDLAFVIQNFFEVTVRIAADRPDIGNYRARRQDRMEDTIRISVHAARAILHSGAEDHITFVVE